MASPRWDAFEIADLECPAEVDAAALALVSAGLAPTTLRVLEMAAIKNALRLAMGNRTVAAKSLGIALRTLQRKLKYWPESASSYGRGK